MNSRPGYDPASLIGGLLVIALGTLLMLEPFSVAATLRFPRRPVGERFERRLERRVGQHRSVD